MIFLISIVVIGMIAGWYIFTPNHSAVRKKPKSKPRPGKYDHMNRDGSVNVAKLIGSDNFQRQLEGFRRIYMRETILALWQGKRPPNQVGGYGVLTKKKLIVEWNDDWQKEMDELEDYYEISYNILFGIPDEHPEAGTVYTSNEIASKYGREKENN